MPVISSVKALSASSVQVEWNTISSGSEDIQSYVIEFINANMTHEVKAETLLNSQTTMRHDFMDLKPNTRYDLRIRARNPNGFSKYSDVVSVTTLKEGKLYLIVPFLMRTMSTSFS